MNRHGNILSVCLAAMTAQVLADGCFVWQGGADLAEPSQKAAICLRGGTETMVLQVKYEGPAADFAWVVPLPARPEVSAVDPAKSPFAELSMYTQRRAHSLYDGRKGEEEIAGVEVLERKTAGVYDAAVLAASDAGALADWLSRNGYAFPENRTDTLRAYVKNRWFYVAMRINPRALSMDRAGKVRAGELQPVRFSFPAKQAVYPLQISSLNTGRTEVLLYLLGEKPLVHAGGPTNAGFDLIASFPLFPKGEQQEGRADPDYGTFPKATAAILPLAWETLNIPTNSALHVCKYRAIYESAGMTGDLLFSPIEPVALWEAQLKEAGANLRRQVPPLTRLAATSTRYALRLGEVKAQVKEWEEKEFRESRRKALVQRVADADPVERGIAAGDRDLPLDLIRQLARDKEPGVRAIIAARKDIANAEGIMKALAADADASVREALAFNDAVPGPLRAPLLLQDVSVGRKVDLGYKCTDPEILMALSADTNKEVRFAVAHNAHAPTQALWRLAGDPERNTKVAAARNVHAPESLILKIAGDPDPYVRHDIAMATRDTPALPVSVLRQMAKDSDDTVRDYLCSHTNLPPDLVAALATDKAPRVRADIAANPLLPPEQLLVFAADSNSMIRAGAVRNPRCPPEVIRRLAEDRDYSVREALVRRPDSPTDILVALARTKDTIVLLRLSEREFIPPEVLACMADSDDSRIRESVVGRTNTPLPALLALARDKDENVLKALAADTNTPPEAFRFLVNDKRERLYWVLFAVAENPNTPADVLARLADDRDRTIRAAVAKHRSAAPEVLRRLARDKDAFVRSPAMVNPNTPAETLRELAGDPDKGVAQAAQSILKQRGLTD